MIRIKKIIKILVFAFYGIANGLSAQSYIPADPFDLLFTEQKIMMGGKDFGSLMIRSIVLQNEKNNSWSLKMRSDFFYNDGAPNLENTSDKWVGKGVSLFTGANISFNSKYFFISSEPYVFTSQNKDYDEPDRITKFMHLNDNQAHDDTPYNRYGLRETQVYLKYNEFGIGWSNANMWWGSGIHSSLMMSNNTTGFGHLMIGTVNEKRINNWGFNGRYVFSKFGEKSNSKPYYSGFIVNSTYYSKPIVTLGFARSFLSGGEYSNYDMGVLEAALLPFEFVTVDNSTDDALNPVAQIYTGYVNIRFPESGLVTFIEYGRNEGPENFKDLLLHPDHSRTYIFGIRKYGLFNNINLMFGIEYANLTQTAYWQLRDTPDWNSASQFDYNTYDGRYWGPHSGPDSDDFTIYFAYNNNRFSIIPSINYERHNVTHPNSLVYQFANTIVFDNFFGDYFIDEKRTVLYDMSHLAEGKVEFKIDLRYVYKGFRFLLYYEFETLYNEAFLHSSSRSEVEKKHTNVIWLGVEKYFNGVLNLKFK